MSRFVQVLQTDYGIYPLPVSVAAVLERVKWIPVEADLVQGRVTIAEPDVSDELSRQYAEWEESEFKRAEECFRSGEEYQPSEWPKDDEVYA